MSTTGHSSRLAFTFIENIFIYSYDKDETLKIDNPKLLTYTHLLVELKGKFVYDSERLQKSHDTLETVNCFNNIGVEYRSLLPVKIKTKPCISIMKRKEGFKPPEIVDVQKELPKAQEEVVVAPETPPKKEETPPSIDVVEDQPEEDLFLDDFDLNDLDVLKEETKDELHEWNDKIDEAEFSEMKKPSKQSKIKHLIEKHYRKKLKENTEIARVQKRSAKSNIKHIIKSEKIKEMAEKISHMDLKTKCDLEAESVKGCLIKIIEELDVK